MGGKRRWKKSRLTAEEVFQKVREGLRLVNIKKSEGNVGEKYQALEKLEGTNPRDETVSREVPHTPPGGKGPR